MNPWIQGLKSTKASGETSGKVSVKTSVIISAAKRLNPNVTIPELSAQIDVAKRSIEQSIRKLQESKQLHYVSPAKSDHWEVLE